MCIRDRKSSQGQTDSGAAGLNRKPTTGSGSQHHGSVSIGRPTAPIRKWMGLIVKPSEALMLAQASGERWHGPTSVSYTHLRAHETPEHLVCRLLLEKKKKKTKKKRIKRFKNKIERDKRKKTKNK
eukprot:TRINITY_DN40170_c0_g1_i1.p1 TRINITY_DN40170_c0_g1~~TRINITY_DN40170_c0_g1_i1.p1  ORF type:complete len:126 (-),score=26.59 TRINITY_DN40170_c0_g1_i1:16-393(-)